MSATQALPDDFFKQFKSKEEFKAFFDDMFKRGIESMLKAELEAHLGYEKHSKLGYGTGNSRNGYYKKTVKSESLGDMVLNIPRDRNGEFEPQLIPKGQRMSDKLSDAIIGMYGRGMSASDICEQVREIYGVEISEGTVSNVTNQLLETVKEWQNRPLETVYPIVWMDGIMLKVKQNARFINKCVFLVIGLRRDGKKEVLGIWIAENESSSFWLNVLTDLKARGVEDILIACTDNLKGFTEAIKAVFPFTATQLCIVHQIRNSCHYVIWKDRKAFCADLKDVYNATNRDAAETALSAMEQKWGEKYGYAFRSWRNNWDNLTIYFDYPMEIRKIIYTTNAIESLNRTVRKYTKPKVQFVDDTAALKAVYLAIMNQTRTWTQPIPNWGLVLNQLLIIFGDRCKMEK
jgi:putative transposase